jgi:hypothetical protein
MTEVRVYNAEARVVMTEARIRCAEKHALYVVSLIATASSCLGLINQVKRSIVTYKM